MSMRLKIARRPKKIDAAYKADFYCKYENRAHVEDEFPVHVEGESWGDAIRQVRAQGWIVHRDHTATCPKCVAALTMSPEERSFMPVLETLDETLRRLLEKNRRSPKAVEAINSIAKALEEAVSTTH